jgi:hypothetical protein
MLETPDKRKPQKSPERGQAPLWFIIVGMGVILFSRGIKDEMIAEVVFWFGVIFSVIASLYWLFRPKHGVR